MTRRGEACRGAPRFFTTDALVIGSMRYREADRIVTLYTRDRGRLSAVAKGVRRTKSKVGGRLEPFSLVRVSLYSGRGSLYTVVGVETVRTFQGVRDELFRMEEGARLLTAVRHLFPGEEASAPAFNLLVRGVARLAEAEDAGDGLGRGTCHPAEAAGAARVCARDVALRMLRQRRAALRFFARALAAWSASPASKRPARPASPSVQGPSRRCACCARTRSPISKTSNSTIGRRPKSSRCWSQTLAFHGH